MKTQTISEVFGMPEGSFLRFIAERKAKEQQDLILQRIFIREAVEAKRNGTYDEFIKLHRDLPTSSSQETLMSSLGNQEE